MDISTIIIIAGAILSLSSAIHFCRKMYIGKKVAEERLIRLKRSLIDIRSSANEFTETMYDFRERYASAAESVITLLADAMREEDALIYHAMSTWYVDMNPEGVLEDIDEMIDNFKRSVTDIPLPTEEALQYYKSRADGRMAIFGKHLDILIACKELLERVQTINALTPAD